MTRRSTEAETMTRVLTEPDATHAFGLAIGRLLRPGDTIALHGPLGAGKTTLTRSIAEGAGVPPRDVSSPTFVIAQEYETRGNEHDVEVIVHVDAYRLGEDELDSIGWDRFTRGGLAAMGGAMLVEWPDRLGDGLTEVGERLKIELEVTGETSRVATLTAPACWASRETFEAFAAREPTRCRKTGRWVAPDAPSWPFVDERAQMADLYGWMSESYTISREMKDSDLEETE